MSELPDRDELRESIDRFLVKEPAIDYSLHGDVSKILKVARAVANGELKSRDEMNEEAAARRWMEDDEHTPYYMPYSEAVKNLLDAAWGVADEDS